MGFVARFFLLVFVLTMSEFYLLMFVAQHTSLLLTVLLSVLTGVLGGMLVRAQGLRCLRDIQRAMAAGEIPANEIVSGLILVVIGTLLLTPGFITDTLAFTMLVPPIRLWTANRLVGYFKKRVVLHKSGSFGTGASGFRRSPDGGVVIDVEGEDVAPSPNGRIDSP
ncbi:FxsA family protein [Sulfidibacter corallicola]|uniref:FxsA family protein n=1 Tax=Sulfidibacter corallicola TaxID=2818388 RepID=A0A8A4TYC8_SULCO|nr:FxsA family protein [Sulfidibacter corallicola]QTD54337.1 FxsA family protein [Sulfidibacter corallicola]